MESIIVRARSEPPTSSPSTQIAVLDLDTWWTSRARTRSSPLVSVNSAELPPYRSSLPKIQAKRRRRMGQERPFEGRIRAYLRAGILVSLAAVASLFLGVCVWQDGGDALLLAL